MEGLGQIVIGARVDALDCSIQEPRAVKIKIGVTIPAERNFLNDGDPIKRV